VRRLAQDERVAGRAKPAGILIVEDDYLVSVQALTDAGFDVVGVANSAEAALELARTGKPDLVVMDIRLAGDRDGVDIAKELFGALGLRSIFATAHNEEAIRRRAQPAKPLGWLPKPYTMDALCSLVRRSLDAIRNDDRS
jgi:DNA-binding NarL/FixJ family response regulator